MIARERRLEIALLALFLEAEEMAVASYETCTYPGGAFNDAIWRKKEGTTFKRAVAARRLLHLRPFSHKDTREFGGAGDRLTALRKEQWALLKKENK